YTVVGKRYVFSASLDKSQVGKGVNLRCEVHRALCDVHSCIRRGLKGASDITSSATAPAANFQYSLAPDIRFGCEAVVHLHGTFLNLRVIRQVSRQFVIVREIPIIHELPVCGANFTGKNLVRDLGVQTLEPCVTLECLDD